MIQINVHWYHKHVIFVEPSGKIHQLKHTDIYDLEFLRKYNDMKDVEVIIHDKEIYETSKNILGNQ